MKSPIALLLCAAVPAFAGEALPLKVEASKQVLMADQVITLQKVAPPVLARRPAPVAPPVVQRTQTLEELRAEAKTWRSLNVTATVYPTTPVLTELRVRTDEKEYVCLSNVDFRDLTQIGQFEDEHSVYAWFPFVSEGDPAEVAKFPDGLSKTYPDFVVVGGQHDVQALKGLDVVHAYYAANKDRLAKERVAREAEAAKREQELRDNPPVKQPITFQFWEMPTAK